MGDQILSAETAGGQQGEPTLDSLNLDRRSVLRKGLIWGSLGVAASTVGIASPASGTSARGRKRTVFDVACLGDTFRLLAPPGATFPDPTNPSKPFDARGATFWVEGAIYPANTIRQAQGFDPSQHEDERTGTWLCRGWFMFHSGRPEPHVATTQEYVLGNIRKEQRFPPDTLVSSGLEGADDEREPAIRAVVGGTGRFIDSRGVVRQHIIGTNTTVIPNVGNAPNFRFRFSLR